MKNRGMTLIEMLVVLGMTSIVGLICLSFLITTTTSLSGLSGYVEQSTEKVVAERFFYYDLQSSSPSYNFLNQPDDLGRSFYEHFQNGAPPSLSEREKSRQITLKVGAKTQMYILVQDRRLGNGITYDPVVAYSVGAIPDYDKSATLSYSGLNNGGYVSKKDPSSWIQGNLMLMDAPIYLKQRDAQGRVIQGVPSRSPMFLGSVSGNDLVAFKGGGLFNSTHPSNTARTISSADQFLRWVPPVGGAAAVVRLYPVKLVRYRIQPHPEAKPGGPPYINVMRSEWQNGVFKSEQIVMNRVLAVTFIRSDIGLGVVSVEITEG